MTPKDSADIPVPDADQTRELEALVDEWLTVPDISERLGIDVLRVRQLFRDGRLLAVRRGERDVLSVPAGFIGDGDVVKGLSGVLNLLRDGGFDAVEMMRWLYTDDDSLPGTPVQALQENRGTEVKRRAQALAL